MNFSNPLEIIIVIVLAVLSVWMIEKIIAGAFKTVLIGIIIALIFAGVAYHSQQKKRKPLPHFTLQDLTDYTAFKKKIVPYEQETVKDIKESYLNAKKDIHNR